MFEIRGDDRVGGVWLGRRGDRTLLNRLDGGDINVQVDKGR